jgi:hypothetical protein
MAVDCFVHQLIFVVVTVVPDSADEIGLVVIDAGGDTLKFGQTNLDGVDEFLAPWLVVQHVHVKFVCSLLSGKNTRILARHLADLGHHNVSYNGIAYSSLTDYDLLAYVDEDMFDIGYVFSMHIEDHIFACGQPRTPVFFVCAYGKHTGLSVAAGTLYHGVQVARRVRYATDICETLLPWFTKPSHYEMILVSNYSTCHVLQKVEGALSLHACTLGGISTARIHDKHERLGKFLLLEADKPGFVFAGALLEMFIIQERIK